MPDHEDDPPTLSRWRDGRVWLVVGAPALMLAYGWQQQYGGGGDRPRFFAVFVAIL